jgi:hypothetical protein
MPRLPAIAALALSLAACAAPPARATGTAEGSAGIAHELQHDQHVKDWRRARATP